MFSRGQDADGVRSVSIAQAAIDCLTGPGRMPAEGEALLVWMRQLTWGQTSLGSRVASLIKRHYLYIHG